MKVFTIQKHPSAEEIAAALQTEFSSKYEYNLFGIGDSKSVILKKSGLVGAQISRSGNTITVHAMLPNLLLSSLDALLSGLVSFGSQASFANLEKNLVSFLKIKYGN